MCCSLEFVPSDVQLIQEAGNKNYTVIIDATPKSFSHRVTRFFQQIERLEKLAEIADESFHLLGQFLKTHASMPIYQTLKNLHDGAHVWEHTLHPLCFLSDISRYFSSERYFEYKEGKLLYLRSFARLCHTCSHFFATATFLAEHQLLSFEKEFGSKVSLLSASGYGACTFSLIWERAIKTSTTPHSHFNKDLVIHLSGFLFEGIHALAPRSELFNQLGALAGIIHAAAIFYRLWPKDRQKFKNIAI